MRNTALLIAIIVILACFSGCAQKESNIQKTAVEILSYERPVPNGYTRLADDSQGLFAFSNSEGEMTYRVYGKRDVLVDGLLIDTETGFYPAQAHRTEYGRFAVTVAEDAKLVSPANEQLGIIDSHIIPELELPEGYRPVRDIDNLLWYHDEEGALHYRSYGSIAGHAPTLWPCDADGVIMPGALPIDMIEENIYYGNGDGADMILSNDRIVYKGGFSYEPVPQEVIDRTYGVSYKENTYITYNDLNYVRILYMDFEGYAHEGELLCNKSISQDLVEIFYELYIAGYPLASVHLIDAFGADDERSMEANNTSCFCYRVVEGSSKLSSHARGLAVDINPLLNPHVKKNSVAPASGAPYADRTKDFRGKITTDDLCYQLFTARGFTWGGTWNSSKDYQHFEKTE